MIQAKRVAIICNGPIDDLSFVQKQLLMFSSIIAVDGGANHCQMINIYPHLIVGDLDSISPLSLEKFNSVEKRIFPKDKDFTDFELALQEIDWESVTEVTVFGALEGRIDHTLANLLLLSQYPGKMRFESRTESCFFIKASAEIVTKPFQVISLIPLNGPCHGVCSTGLKWEINNATLQKNFISISNEALSDKVIITVKEGDLFCSIQVDLSHSGTAIS